MRFWDASAIVPLLVNEPSSRAMADLFRDDHEVAVWWTTHLECVSALTRRERAQQIPAVQARNALSRLDDFAVGWQEVAPSDEVRRTARRVTRSYGLRAGDALQLAASIVAAERDPTSLPFVSLDADLVDAARIEGFSVFSV